MGKKKENDLSYYLTYCLRMLRIINEQSLSYVSRKTGFSPSYLSEIENGKKDVTFEILFKYSDLYGKRTSRIIQCAEEMLDTEIENGKVNKIYFFKEFLL